ncbi:MAG: GNAT family N-acetyltransferase [Methylococcales bacterium]|nr:GNAT family N-acetyltransferase [Methylococcales bacterium]
MDIEEFRQKITAGAITVTSRSTAIQQGKLNHNDNDIPYEIKHGWQIHYANDCDIAWTAFYTQLFEHIEQLNLPEDRQMEILNSLSTQDQHWDWYRKACIYKSDEDEWFFLMAEDKPQGVCIINHPKASKLTAGNIFYLEYLAVAPWNRNSLIYNRKFKGIGSILLKCAINYAMQTLKLQPGFSLHSLEQAESWYLKIGMTRLPSEDKPNLKFFEMDADTTQEWVSIS